MNPVGKLTSIIAGMAASADSSEDLRAGDPLAWDEADSARCT
jgi:hypothetical protein